MVSMTVMVIVVMEFPLQFLPVTSLFCIAVECESGDAGGDQGDGIWMQLGLRCRGRVRGAIVAANMASV